MIKNLIFDIGGVILFDWMPALEACLNELNM